MSSLTKPVALLLLLLPFTCRCQRGIQMIVTCGGGSEEPVPGPVGPPGKRGPPGPVGHQGVQGFKGEPGANDTWKNDFTRLEGRLIALEKKLLKTVSCSTNGDSENPVTQIDCPPGCRGNTYSCGTGIYTIDSSVCAAAVQQGIIKEHIGGSVTFLKYTNGVNIGSNNISTSCTGSWFTFEDIDECATSTPCRNNAICVDLVARYHCKCSSWYSGRNCETDCSLGVRYDRKTIPDSAMTASSYWDQGIRTGHQPKFGRLNQLDTEGVSISGWASAQNNIGQWIEVALSRTQTITGVITQGRGYSQYMQWVTSYKIAYLPSNTTSWKYVSYANGSDIVFDGNTDQATPVKRRFPQPVIATKLRLYPQTYHGHMTLRHEYLIC